MTSKLIVTLGASFALATAAAYAQTTTDTTTTTETAATVEAGKLPADWSAEVRSAFFMDVEQGTLKTEDEVRAGWATLDTEEQASVRAYCDQQDTAAMDTQTGTSTDSTAAPLPESSGTDTTAGATDEDMGTSSETTASTAAGDMHHASLTQLCGWVDTLE